MDESVIDINQLDTSTAVRKEAFTVEVQNCDTEARMTPAGIADHFQVAASRHAKEHGFGFSDLGSKNQVFVLSRLGFRVHSLPRYAERVKLYTWTPGNKRLFAMRNFIILRENGEVAVAGDSAWILMDTQKMRPIRTDSFFKVFPLYGNIENDILTEKIDAVTDGTEVRKFSVPYTHMDINGHVNNARYIEWFINCYPLKHHLENSVARFRINYLSEVKADKEIVIMGDNMAYSTNSPNRFDAIADAKPVCRAEISWILR